MNSKHIDHIPDGSVVFFSAVFGYKHLFYKPFHYIIQVVTRSKYHHVGIVSNNLFYEASSKTGVRCIKFKDVLPRDNNPEELRRILIELGYKSYG